MIRVYLDWNIFSYLKQFKTEKEPYISLNKNLTNNKDKILIPYTSAHLTDLITSYKQSEKGKLQTLDDLDYLAELTSHQCIVYDYKTQETHPNKYTILDYFNQLLDSDDIYSSSFEDLFSSDEDNELSGLKTSLINLLKHLPTGIDTSVFDKISSKFQPLKDVFKKTAEQIHITTCLMIV